MNNFITQETAAILSQEAEIAEQIGQLTALQCNIIYREKWFNAFVPETYGGLALSLPEGLLLEEALAKIDGSLGWTVTLCSGAAMFVGYLQQDWSAEAFVQPDVCFAGSGRPNGIATIVEDGFRVSGQWDYATGAPHATIFTANAVVYNNGLPLLTEDGTPTILSFCFKREEVKIIENWATMGMKATAGNSFEVENIWVPSNRTFTIDAQHCILPNPLYQYPFLSFAELTTAVNTLGMGMHFLEECQEIFSQKIAKQPENKDLKAMLLNESNLIYEQRKAFYEIAQASWQECITTGELSATTMAQISDTCKTMVRKIRKMANQLYPYCGMVAAITDTRINRIWRDLFTASQHSLLL